MKKALQFLAVAALILAAHGNALAYDGSVVAPAGQTLYYDFVDNTGSSTIELQSSQLSTGTYLVKVGRHVARKIVLINQ